MASSARPPVFDRWLWQPTQYVSSIARGVTAAAAGSDGGGRDEVWAPVSATATDPHTPTANRAARARREQVAICVEPGQVYAPCALGHPMDGTVCPAL